MVPHVPVHVIAAGHRRQAVIKAFQKASAASAGGARTLAELSLKDDGTLRGLMKQEVVRTLPDGRFYLDEGRLGDLNALNARIGLSVALVIFLIIVIVLALRP
jgi:hypothetical protein